MSSDCCDGFLTVLFLILIFVSVRHTCHYVHDIMKHVDKSLPIPEVVR